MNTVLEQVNSIGEAFVGLAASMLVWSTVLIGPLVLLDCVLRKKVAARVRYWIWMVAIVQLVLPISWPSLRISGSWFGGDAGYTASEAESMAAGIAARLTASLTWQGVMLLVWLTVAAGMVLFLWRRSVFVRRLVAQAKDANNLMNDVLRYCCWCMGVKGRVCLKVSATVRSPMVCGLFRPVILVPDNLASGLGSRHLRAVLLHELAHVRRGDLWMNLVQTVLQIIYFYNPLLWFANSIIRRVREQAVDETVLVAMGEKAQWYLETLINVARLAFRRPALSLRVIGVVESKSVLARRIRHILKGPIPHSAKLGPVREHHAKTPRIPPVKSERMNRKTEKCCSMRTW
ncbi:MAG: M56 family metallopeptidase [Planctomycetota bacterium]|jgi:bla regulator protein BlaR1